MATAEDGERHAWNVANREPGPWGLDTLRLGFHSQPCGDLAGLWVRPYWPGDKGVGEPSRFGYSDRGLVLLGRDQDNRHRTMRGMGFGN